MDGAELRASTLDCVRLRSVRIPGVAQPQEPLVSALAQLHVSELQCTSYWH